MDYSFYLVRFAFFSLFANLMKLWRSSRSISFQLLAGLVGSGAGVAAWMGFWVATVILLPVFLIVLLHVSFGVAFKYFHFNLIVNRTSEWVKFSIKLEKSNFKFVIELISKSKKECQGNTLSNSIRNISSGDQEIEFYEIEIGG